MRSDGRLHQCKRIEDPHGILVPPLRVQHRAEYIESGGMMPVCAEHLKAFGLCFIELSACQISPRTAQQHFRIE